MKKLLLLLTFAFLFIGCEKIEPFEPYFFNGEWTTHLSNKNDPTINLFICYDIKSISNYDNIIHTNTSYICSNSNCYDWNSTYFLERFEFYPRDSTLYYILHVDSLIQYRYFGKYDKKSDKFFGKTYYYDINRFGDLYNMSHTDNDLTTRGMIYH